LNKIAIEDKVFIWVLHCSFKEKGTATSDLIATIHKNWNAVSLDLQYRIHEEIKRGLLEFGEELTPKDKFLWTETLRLVKKSDKTDIYPIDRLDGKVGIE
jgi:hypothetical protein